MYIRANFGSTGGKPSPMYMPVSDNWLVAPVIGNRLHNVDAMLLGAGSMSSGALAGWQVGSTSIPIEGRVLSGALSTPERASAKGIMPRPAQGNKHTAGCVMTTLG